MDYRESRVMYRLVAILFVILPLSAFADIASTGYVDDRVAAQVKTTGDQEIAGTKTYTTSPIVPTPPLP